MFSDGVLQALATLVAAAIAIGGIVLQLRLSARQSLEVEIQRLELERQSVERNSRASRVKLLSLGAREIAHNGQAATTALEAMKELAQSSYPLPETIDRVIEALADRIDIATTWSLNGEVNSLEPDEIYAMTGYWIAARAAQSSLLRLPALTKAGSQLAQEAVKLATGALEEFRQSCDEAVTIVPSRYANERQPVPLRADGLSA